MRPRLPLVLGLSALGFVLAVMPADASESRYTEFPITCDGVAHLFIFQAGSFASNVTRLIQGVGMSVFPSQDAQSAASGAPSLRYLVMSIGGDPNKVLLTMGSGQTNADAEFTGFYQAPTGPAGIVSVWITA